MRLNLYGFLIQPIENYIVRKVKGVVGEWKLRFVLWLMLGFTYNIINNVTIRLPNNKTSQIDHLVISRRGIFVIETKNFKGDITVNESSGYWTQSFHTRSYKFYSPIKQNNGHISSLKYLLKNKNYPYFNIVCFVGTATFYQKRTPKELSVGLLNTVRLIKSKRKKVLSRSEVKHIVQKIEQDRMPNNWRTRRLHLKNVKAHRRH